MTWDATAAIAELLGALAVVISILILTRQVRESNRVAKAEAIRARGMRMVDIWFRVAENERLSRAVGAAFFDNQPLEALDIGDQRSMHMVIRSLALLWESEYLENQHGALDDDVWAPRVDSIAAMLEKPAYGAIWTDVQPLLTVGFVKQVERVRDRNRSSKAAARSHAAEPLPAQD